MDTYLIAVRQDCRSDVPKTWPDRLKDIEGFVIIGDGNPYRIQVEATPKAIRAVRDRVSSFCHIESVIPHRPLTA